jgi:hypothetical protein
MTVLSGVVDFNATHRALRRLSRGLNRFQRGKNLDDDRSAIYR